MENLGISIMPIFAQYSERFWEDKKVFITGHSGFKGSWLTLYLLMKGATVYGYFIDNGANNLIALLFTNLNKYDLPGKLEKSLTNSDILDCELLFESLNSFRPDLVFHLAAQPLVLVGYREPRATWCVNVNGTLNLLECLKDNVDIDPILLIATTEKVYLNTDDGRYFKETDALGADDPYGASKVVVENLVKCWKKALSCHNLAYKKANIIVTLRAGNVIGGGDNSPYRIIPDIINAFKKLEQPILRHPHASRPWQHVLDPLSGYVMFAEALHNGLHRGCIQELLTTDSLNFGPDSHEGMSVYNVANKIAELWSLPFECKGESEHKHTPHEYNMLHLDSSLAVKFLGWTARYGYNKAIEITLRWFSRYYEGEDPINLCVGDIQRHLANSVRYKFKH